MAGADPQTERRRAVIVGGTRGLGLALTEAYLQVGWAVVATRRASSAASGLEMLANRYGDRLSVDHVDTTQPDQIRALADRQSAPIDLLLVNAAAGGEMDATFALQDIIVVNAVGPVQVLDALIGRVVVGGVAAVMTSIAGSVALNDRGGLDAYRASKAALNSLTRSFAARHPPKDYTLLSLHPGWVRTGMGGPNAAIPVETSVDGMMR